MKLKIHHLIGNVIYVNYTLTAQIRTNITTDH